MNDIAAFPAYSEVEAEEARNRPIAFAMGVSTPARLPGQGDRPFLRGVIEPLLHGTGPEQPKRRSYLKARRGTDLRFRYNMTTGSPEAAGAMLDAQGNNSSSSLHQASVIDSSHGNFIDTQKPTNSTNIASADNTNLPIKMENGVALGKIRNDTPVPRFCVMHNSSSSDASSFHGSKASSGSSAIKPTLSNDHVNLLSRFHGVSMHTTESSIASSHVRAANAFGTDNTTSTVSLSHPEAGMAALAYSEISRPVTNFTDTTMPSYHNRAGSGLQPSQYHGGGNVPWSQAGPPSSQSSFCTVNNQGYPAVSGPTYGAHPYAIQEPTAIYRTTTYPTQQTRAPAPMQRGATYPYAYGQDGPQNSVYQHPQFGVGNSRLNAGAAEFSRPSSANTSYNGSHLNKYVYLHPAQQINWRQLLEPGVTADWDLVVDKIISSNDQQASIFLQQKIKNSEVTTKDDIIASIIHRGLELMGNRFGNFLIQRVFECANEEQIMGLAAHIQGHTVRLSTDAFGCHVIQKAFDCVPEGFKHQMVRELLTRIRDTIVHRYACHVWQKLFELRWQGPPPMIMGTVNAALVNQWSQVAIGETGSLVVQNIFENCNEEDKRPCINEVLANLDQIARGQYGNWCIQHICEHGDADDRDAAISMILAQAAEYSMDQYASKCIEKCLKVCGTDFLDRYLQQVLMRGPAETFSPLVQIARDQYGNFLVQWILNNANPHLRDIIQAEIRKHLVSLRGNKYGSKVAMTCGYGPQGVRPGVPFAPAGHRNSGNGPRGPPPYQPVPNHSTNYQLQYQYGQMDGGPPPMVYHNNFAPAPPRPYMSYSNASAPYPGY